MTPIEYEEPRSLGPLAAESSFIIVAILFPIAGVGLALFVPDVFPLDFPFVLTALGLFFIPAAWVFAMWPSAKARMLEAFPVRIKDAGVCFPASPFARARKEMIPLASVERIVADGDVMDGLLYLVLLDTAGGSRARAYRPSDGRRLEVYRETVEALSRVTRVVRSPSRQPPDLRERRARMIALVAPIVALLISCLIFPPWTPDGFLSALAWTTLVGCLVSMPTVCRSRARRLRASVREAQR